MKKMTYLLLAVLVVLMLPLTSMAAENDVAAMIEALPTVEEFQAMDADAQLEAYNQTQAAYDAYMALPEEEKAALEGAEETFEALFGYYNTLVAPAGEAEAAPAEEVPQDDGRRAAALKAMMIVMAANGVALFMTTLGPKRKR